MRPLKRILKSEIVRRFFCFLASLYIRLAFHSGRWSVVGGEIPKRFWDEGKPFILGFWHGRLLMMPYCWDPKKTIHMLISQHRDGQLIARTVGHFGIKTAAGSSTRGGAQALRTMVKALGRGEYVGITPDGPRGPRMRASEGVVSVARLSGVPVIPAAFGCNRGRVISSWDRFLIAWPFTRGVIVWGEPVMVDRAADASAQETARQQIEDGLNAVTAEADRLSARSPVKPAEEGGGR
ncbi:MAG: lysophospholipid acyltransferase family protein [Proteobacteria bacterium]|nr:lysophospholipid acyltransferase family protein [Pseudomonadota bacterium]MDA1022493.1 lysophospholipid acyltransferase family protein [Pseudomonadota bacterium]